MLLTQPNRFTISNRTIKNNHLYLVDDSNGEISYQNDSGFGLYNLDTRFLSRYEIRINGTEPVCLLSSTELGYLSTLVYTNGQMEGRNIDGAPCRILEETVQLKRESVLNGALVEKYLVVSYNIEPVQIEVSLQFDADFQDIFEIRHLVPQLKRVLNPPRRENNDTLLFSYHKDQADYETRILFKDVIPEFREPTVVVYKKLLFPLERFEFNIEIRPIKKQERESIGVVEVKSYENIVDMVQASNRIWQEEATEFTSDNEDFTEMMDRSQKDIRMLLTVWDNQTYVAAGIPWYVSLFGRDSVITARDCLMINPAIAKWTLYVLAKYQGTRYNPWRDEEPGKILHELRVGELAKEGLVPHNPYYGSVDSTPLWLILLHDYFQWTSDIETVTELWPNALAALDWINRTLAKNELGYATYLTQSPKGIVHQGWKDSNTSAMYENGLQAEPPIALAEVQGYVYMAKRGMASFAELFGDRELKFQLKRECRQLKQSFNKDFWMPEFNFCPLGLDSQGRPLRVISSNPGHCLETGILTVSHARQVASRLMEPDMFSGWGIRTLSSGTLAYNPMSYHNGSVWPHDNAYIARGMSIIGRPDLSERIFSGLYEAARLMQYKRLPELFCGFSRDPCKIDPPVRYPVACSPQAWSAASMFSFIRSMVSMVPDLPSNSIRIARPRLPYFMNSLIIRKLRIGASSVDLEFRRAGKTVVVDVLNRHGKLDILVKK